MISRQIGATLSTCSGPVLTAFRPSITCASRSGRNATEPSRFLISPTASASAARRFSSAEQFAVDAVDLLAQRQQFGRRVGSPSARPRRGLAASALRLAAARDFFGAAAGAGASPAGCHRRGACPSAARARAASGRSPGFASATNFSASARCISGASDWILLVHRRFEQRDHLACSSSSLNFCSTSAPIVVGASLIAWSLTIGAPLGVLADIGLDLLADGLAAVRRHRAARP